MHVHLSPIPLISTLPDEPAFAPIIAEFVRHLRRKLEVMDDAVRRGDLAELAGLGHWLKGSGATLGFPDLGECGAELEQHARDQHLFKCVRTVAGIRELGGIL